MSQASIDRTPLNEDEIEQLEAFIFSPAVSEESLDFLGIHGLLTALAAAPVEVPQEEWVEVIFDGIPGYADEQQKKFINELLVREYHALCDELNSEEAPELPCELELDDEEETLLSWSQGFMEGVFLRETEWFNQQEEVVAEMLLPIMLASELFDEAELVEMRKDKKLCQQLIEEIPDLITDLYLLFRVPEEKKTSKPQGGRRKH